MLGKDGHIATHFDYIKRYAEQAKLTPVKACMKLLDTCLKVIEEIVSESQSAKPENIQIPQSKQTLSGISPLHAKLYTQINVCNSAGVTKAPELQKVA
jgi:hypothetical protein